jgi:hypothetical protein
LGSDSTEIQYRQAGQVTGQLKGCVAIGEMCGMYTSLGVCGHRDTIEAARAGHRPVGAEGGGACAST